ncbi:MAG: NAD(P)/FAD-dependent oxidoreductase, partial [Sedimentisphaerales bacterium]|nr:NAD(P)/FAD-dependent oxidoreductase [Sedimentisphaerales bacterium]
MKEKTAVIIGAGPAGLTAAYELLNKTDIKPIIFERTGDIGGISKTVNYKGNRIDLGGHRFYSKSDRVMQWWCNILPLQGAPSRDDIALGRKVPLSTEADAPDPEKEDRVMLIRSRLSRIFFIRKFFDYPISLNFKTFSYLGLIRIIKICLSYIKIRLFPIKAEVTLEDFFINRFGREVYSLFFKDYTKKVWGVPCNEISSEWGAKRIKGLSISKAVAHAIRNMFAKDSSVGQKNVETTLIGQFVYPKFGPGQLWEEVARIIKEKGGQIYLNHKVTGLRSEDNKITEVNVENVITGEQTSERADYLFSTMPVKELINSFEGGVPEDVKKVADGLICRAFMTVGLLLKKLKIKNETKIKTVNNIIPDDWIYIQEKDVKIGRLQIFNNWSPYMVKDPNTVWIGLEYFCTAGDELWNKSDEEFSRLGIDELARINIIDKEDVLDSVAIRTPNSYPAYFGTYGQFDIIRNFVDKFENLFLVGRGG